MSLHIPALNINVFSFLLEYADIEGFTTLSESISAEVLVEILEDYLEEVSSIIIATGGTVVDFIGDAVVVRTYKI